MSNYRSIDDMSRDYLSNEGFPWSRLWARKVTQVNGADLRIRAKLTYFLLHPTLYANKGYLPGDIEEVAIDIRMKAEHLLQDIDDLVTVGVLRADEDGIYDKRMAQDFGQKFPKKSEKSQKKNNALENTKVCPGELGSEPWLVDKSRVFSGDQATKNDYTGAERTDCRKESGCSLESQPPSGLTETDLSIARKAYEARPDRARLKPFDEVVAKYVRVRQQRGVALTLEGEYGLLNWLAKEKPVKSAKKEERNKIQEAFDATAAAAWDDSDDYGYNLSGDKEEPDPEPEPEPLTAEQLEADNQAREELGMQSTNWDKNVGRFQEILETTRDHIGRLPELSQRLKEAGIKEPTRSASHAMQWKMKQTEAKAA